MSESSPPPFIVIRTPRKQTSYERALELVGLIHEIVETATARPYLRDRLDRTATALVFALGKAANGPATLAWRDLRRAEEAAGEVATVLDIFTAQRAAPADLLVRARTEIGELLLGFRSGRATTP